MGRPPPLAGMSLASTPSTRKFILIIDTMVPTERLELSRLAPPPPQDGVSTNSTTSAVFSAPARQASS